MRYPSAQCGALEGTRGRSAMLGMPSRKSVCVYAKLKTKRDIVLVGDIGGTRSRLSLWKAEGGHKSAEMCAKVYSTQDAEMFEHVLDQFLVEAAAEIGAEHVPAAAALAVAGAVYDNRCAMTNSSLVVDGHALERQHDFPVTVLNDFEAVGYGVPVLGLEDIKQFNANVPMPKAPKVVVGPGTGLGAAQLMWDTGLKDYKVWPGEGAHATFAPRGAKQAALAAWATEQLNGHCEIEHVACGDGLVLIYKFLSNGKTLMASEITAAALAPGGGDPLCVEAVDMMMAIVGAEAGAMSLRSMARGGVYIAGGITPLLLPHLGESGGALVEGFLCRQVRQPFKGILESIPLAVITNGKVGQIGAREVAIKLLKSHVKAHK